MADKQATIYVIDVGSTTGEIHGGRDESNLEFGLRYFWTKIAENMATNRITLNVGVIAFRTNETKNSMYPQDGYHNISVLKSLGKVEMSHIRFLRAKLVTNDAIEGDAISAVVIAMSEIINFTKLKNGKPGKFIRKIILLTDGQSTLDSDDIESITAKVNESEIELIVIGVDFDDPAFGFKEENKSLFKQQNERILRNFVEGCDRGKFCTTAAAVQEISQPTVKEVKPYVTYEGQLTLGDVEMYPESAICIDVKRYFRIKKAKAPTASRYFIHTPDPKVATDNEQSSKIDIVNDEREYDERESVESDDISPVRYMKAYTVDDPFSAGGKRELEIGSLTRGYLYGRSIVPMNGADEGVNKLETFKSFKILGFIPTDQHQKYLAMGESCITVAQPVNDRSQLAMSSLVHALLELESYAIARIVLKNGAEPAIVLLAPYIEPGVLEALVDVPLPFSEDLHIYQFPPFEKVTTGSGDESQEHENLASSDLNSAMSDYVDAMDISSFGRNQEGTPTEFMPIEETYSPSVHRIYHSITQRAMYPDRPLIPPPEVLMKIAKPPLRLAMQTNDQLQELIRVSEVEKAQPVETNNLKKLGQGSD
ncbi:unnamed protein product [Blumeria hordei]|uniref:ATP-dependent DNA helicase II subunit 2 n=1 Tax=Blumeria hordei TaxID=2867405 RepID=A0A383UMK6_BLUHO|nr:unnamed protein product [Blumeria hordei]